MIFDIVHSEEIRTRFYIVPIYRLSMVHLGLSGYGIFYSYCSTKVESRRIALPEKISQGYPSATAVPALLCHAVLIRASWNFHVYLSYSLMLKRPKQ